MPTFPNLTPYSNIRALLNANGLRKNNFTATRLPGASDDISGGWEVGSMWVFNSIVYICVRNTAGGAVWKSSLGGSDGSEFRNDLDVIGVDVGHLRDELAREQARINEAEREAAEASSKAQLALDEHLNTMFAVDAEVRTLRDEVEQKRLADLNVVNTTIADIDRQITEDVSGLRGEVAADLDLIRANNTGISTRLDLIELSVSNTSYIRKTDGEGGIGQWTALTGAAAPSVTTSVPPGQTGSSVLVAAPGAYELPNYGGASLKDSVFRVRGWVQTSAGATGRIAIVSSTNQTVHAQTTPINTNGAWQQIDLRITVNVDTNGWVPAVTVTGGTLRFWRVKLEDFSAASALEASINENATAIVDETTARVAQMKEMKASLVSPLRKLFPVEVKGDYWRQNPGGLPGDAGLYPAVVVSADDYATVPASATTNIHFLSQEALPWQAGKIYRLTVVARSNGQPSNGRLRFLVSKLTAAYATVTNITPSGFNLSVADQWQMHSIEWVVPASTGAETQFRIGVHVNEATLPDVAIDVRSIRIEDISDVRTLAADVTAKLTQDYYTKVAADGAIAASISALETEYFDPSGQVKASALTEYYTKSTSDSAIAAAVTALKSDILTPTGQIKASALNDYYTKTTTDSAISAARTSLKSEMEGPGGSVSAAATAAQNAATAAGSKGKVFFQSTAPSTADRLAQNLWIDTTGGSNTPKRWNGTAWVAVSDKIATDALAAADAAQRAATAISADLTNNYYTKTTTDTAIAVAITALDSKYFTTTGQVKASSLEQYYTKTDANSAVSAAINAHKSEFFTPEGQVRSGALNDYYTRSAADSAIAASSSALTASMNDAFSRGGVISDQFLAAMGTSAWGRWGGQGILSRIANEQYPAGSTWDFNLTATQLDGISLSSGASTWNGQTDASGYVVEAEYTMLSGQVGGAGIRLTWINSSGTNFHVAKPLSDMQSGVGIVGQSRVARGVFKKPANFTGTFSSNQFFFFLNLNETWTGTNVAKRIKIHRINIRVATEEEMGRGEVMGAVQATLTQDYLTKVDTDRAIAASITSYDASMPGGVKANVTQSSTALANLRGGVASFKWMAQTGDASAAGISAVSMERDGDGTKVTHSTLVLHGDNVIAPGTLSTNALVVGLGKNLLIDPTFNDGIAHFTASTSNNEFTFRVRNPGESYAHPAYPTLMIQQNGTSAINAFLTHRPVTQADGTQAFGVPVAAGEYYILSAYMELLRAEGRLIIEWLDAAGTQLSATYSASSQTSSGQQYSPDKWTRHHVKGLAPVGAVYARCLFQKKATQAGQTNSYLFLWKPQLEKVHEQALRPSEWSPGGTTYINGGRLFAKSITAREIAADTITATHLVKTEKIISASGQIGELVVNHFHLRGYSVAKVLKKVFHNGPNNGLWKLTANYPANNWTSGWIQIGVLAVNRVKGYQTDFTIFMDHAGAGSWNSGKPNMSVAQLKWQRRNSNVTTWTDLNIFHAQSGEWGVSIHNTLNFTDTNTAGNVPGVSTVYRLMARKANIVRHQNMSPYLDNFRVEMTHFKQGD